MAERTDEGVLVLEREFEAAPELLFDAWTDPRNLTEWWGPEGMTTPELDLDVRVGGRWSTTMRGQDGVDHHVSGSYRTIERPRRLAFTWAWRQPDGSRGHETLVDVTFEPVAGGTRMVLRQATFQNEQQRDAHRSGWTSSFNDLARHLEGAANPKEKQS